MQKPICWNLSIIFIAFVVFTMTVPVFSQSRSSNSISGFIFGAVDRSPVADVYVELANDLYTTVGRMKTDGSGRYSFNGMSAGNYRVRVLPYGANYLEETQDVTITNYNIGGTTTSDNVYLDIYLKLDKRKINVNEVSSVGAVFVQDVPSQARNLYKKGVSQIGNVKESNLGIENLRKAIDIFPDYYDALNRLGIEHVNRKQYYESLPYLIKAVKINQRSFTSFYALGLAANNLKQLNEAIEAFRITITINKQSALAHFQYGKVLRINGNYDESEKFLIIAKTLAKNVPIAEIHWQLGLLYDKTKRHSEAANELEVYLKLEPDSPNVQQVKDLISRLRTKAK